MAKTLFHKREFYTPGALAKAWGVAPRTVIVWCDKGMLKHHRMPAGDRSGNRRVKRQHALDFAAEHSLPTAMLTGQPDQYTLPAEEPEAGVA